VTVETGKNSSVWAVNRKAFHDFSVLERFEAGIELRGSEVKSIKSGRANLTGGYAAAEGNELILRDVHITPYEQATYFNHEATRPRRLLMRGREIRKLSARMDQMGFTLIPLKLYVKRRWIKIELGLCKGKKMGDKREVLRKRTADREAARAVGNARRK
jgi:SsrA-binding protein